MIETADLQEDILNTLLRIEKLLVGLLKVANAQL